MVLGGEGKIIEQGKFRDLRLKDGFVNKIVLKPELLLLNTDKAEQNGSSATAPSTSTSKPLRGPTASDMDDISRRIGDTAVYKYYLRAIGWKIALVIVTGSFIYMLSANFPRQWRQSIRISDIDNF